MSDKMYDRMKWVALVLLPALAALYFGLGQIWGFPRIEEVVGSVSVLDAFLGLLLNQSSKTHAKLTKDTVHMGDLIVVQEVDGHPATVRLEPKDKVPVFEEGTNASFRVKREQLD